MISLDKRLELYQLFSNAARLDNIENITQAEINKLAPKLRKIFQQQYDLFHQHFPDEEPSHITAEKAAGSSLLSQMAITALATQALTTAFSKTAPEFRDTLAEHTNKVSEQASKAVQKQTEPVIKAIEKEAPAVKAELSVEWKYSNPEIQNKLSDRAAKMVSGIDEVTRQDIHDIITKGHAESKTYAEIAKDIREKYAEFSEPKPQGHIKDRAELIAVTELRYASQETSYDENLALFDEGWDVEKFWNNTGDDKVSDGCMENGDAGWIPLDEESRAETNSARDFRVAAARSRTGSTDGRKDELFGIPDEFIFQFAP